MPLYHLTRDVDKTNINENCELIIRAKNEAEARHINGIVERDKYGKMKKRLLSRK